MKKEYKKGSSSSGRWTTSEHDKFMDALEKYGRDWVKVQKKVKTRSLLQIRSHAQKVFMNMSENDIKAFIGSDQDSVFKELTSNGQAFQSQNKKKKSDCQKKSKVKRHILQKQEEKEDLSVSSNTEHCSKLFFETQDYPKIVFTNFLHESKTGNHSQIPNVQDSFFLQMMYANSFHFKQGGDFFGLLERTEGELSHAPFREFSLC